MARAILFTRKLYNCRVKVRLYLIVIIYLGIVSHVAKLNKYGAKSLSLKPSVFFVRIGIEII